MSVGEMTRVLSWRAAERRLSRGYVDSRGCGAGQVECRIDEQEQVGRGCSRNWGTRWRPSEHLRRSRFGRLGLACVFSFEATQHDVWRGR